MKSVDGFLGVSILGDKELWDELLNRKAELGNLGFAEMVLV